jgi:hypothetical protein
MDCGPYPPLTVEDESEKDQAIEKDQQTILPAGGKQDELSEKDLDKTSGGLGKHYQKWIDVDSIP